MSRQLDAQRAWVRDRARQQRLDDLAEARREVAERNAVAARRRELVDDDADWPCDEERDSVAPDWLTTGANPLRRQQVLADDNIDEP